ncbi:hypothetical protein FY528_13900 [Hymenobacter lutimineralis]|uniref:Uncharacterized protein n=1 Tax=Hymenobacter lutimineralis TaxID=2606448 RepID=A0A5D6UWK0_9BACT|nr:hypothetical protein [Hymenobacter lutimineralis]TYZ08131.1 hypothetical protein FY528_13900 [Hymenobacter lutimineralis]
MIFTCANNQYEISQVNSFASDIAGSSWGLWQCVGQEKELLVELYSRRRNEPVFSTYGTFDVPLAAIAQLLRFFDEQQQ